MKEEVEMTWEPSFDYYLPQFDLFTGKNVSILVADLEAYRRDGSKDILLTRRIPIHIFNAVLNEDGAPVESAPIDPHLLKVAVEMMSPKFVEGEEGKVAIKIKPLHESYHATYSVKVLNAPNTARVKKIKDGVELTWRPPFSTIDSNAYDNMNIYYPYYDTRFPLEVELTARQNTPDEETVSIRRKIYLNVFDQLAYEKTDDQIIVYK